jgi:hypothetical protein
MYNSCMMKGPLVVFLAAVALAGCSTRDITKDLQIVDVRTGWYDYGVIAGGDNKLVPSISFKLKNVSDEDISGVQVNAVFRKVGDDAIIGEHFVPAVGSDTALAPGSTTPEIVLRSKIGYTGSESRLQMLKNSNFVDGRVTILGRHGRSNWIRLQEIPIERQLLTE